MISLSLTKWQNGQMMFRCELKVRLKIFVANTQIYNGWKTEREALKHRTYKIFASG